MAQKNSDDTDTRPVIDEFLEFEVDGFRSLRGSRFRLNKGINVLVGPNGSGKTNIVSLLEFLSQFVSSGANSAFSKVGGASRVFSKEQLTADPTQPARLSIAVHGQLKYKPDSSEPLKKSKTFLGDDREHGAGIVFTYNLSIIFDRSAFELLIEKESVTWRAISDDGSIGDEKSISSSGTSKEQNSTSVEVELFHGLKRTGLFSDKFFETYRDDNIEKLNILSASALERRARSKCSFLSLAAPFGIPDLNSLHNAFEFERSYNIAPDKVRSPTDISSDGEIIGDGSGVIAALYRMQIASDEEGKRRKSKARSSLSSFIEEFRRINDQISKIEVVPNIETGKIDCSATIRSTKNNVKLPLEGLSDGTVKWLAILTILKSKTHGYCVEEPENYLHPTAQRMFIEMLREEAQQKDNPFYIVTTHSETVVNAVRPNELRICEYERGLTQVRGVENPEDVIKAINKTGFGLGFLYANNRL